MTRLGFPFNSKFTISAAGHVLSLTAATARLPRQVGMGRGLDPFRCDPEAGHVAVLDESLVR